MPLIQQKKANNFESKSDLSKNRFSRPQHLDREQLEYSAKTLFTYGVILCTAVGIGASVTYMTVQQLKK